MKTPQDLIREWREIAAHAPDDDSPEADYGRATRDCAADLQRVLDAHRAAEAVTEILATSPDSKAARQLLTLMGDISEECWCAGWYTGVEDILWREMISDNAGRACVTHEQAAELLDLAERGAMWWAWDEEHGEPMPVPLTEWRASRVV